MAVAWFFIMTLLGQAGGALAHPTATAVYAARFVATKLLEREVPLIFVQIVVLVQLAGYIEEAGSPEFDFVEYFAGKLAITQSMRGAGLRAFGYDLEYAVGDETNMLSVSGFIFAVMLACCGIARGAAWFAPVCSSWIWVCRSITGRWEGNAEGRRWIPSVMDGNIMCARTVLLAYFFDAKGSMIGIEQPEGSVMEYSRRFQQLLTERSMFVSPEVALGLFGSASRKPIKVYSNVQSIGAIMQHRLHPSLPAGLATLCRVDTRADGSRACSGRRGILKESQEYPRAFGEAVTRVFKDHIDGAPASSWWDSMPADGLLEIEEVLGAVPEDVWEEANPGPVLLHLMSLVPDVPVWCRP